jgi:hypothetical protein
MRPGYKYLYPIFKFENQQANSFVVFFIFTQKHKPMLLKLNFSSLKNLMTKTLVVLVTLLYACSGNGNTSNKKTENSATAEKKATSGNTVDACSLITEDEAKTLLSSAVTKNMSTGTMCQYVSASDELSKTGESVSIQLFPGAASEFDNYVSNTEKDLNVKPIPVTGIGDKAFFAGGMLMIAKDNDFIVVILGKNMKEAEQIAAEKAIAQKAFERMPTR